MQRIGIVFSSRVRAWLLGLFGLWILFFASTACAQIIYAYIRYGRFDSPPGGVYFVSLCLFAPYLFLAAYVLRSLSARHAFAHLMKQQIVIAEYRPTSVMSPAEAGLIVDNTFHLEEVAATLEYLRLRGNIAVQREGELSFQLLTFDGVSAEERQFLVELFGGSSRLSFELTADKRRFLYVAHQFAETVRSRLVSEGVLSRSRTRSRMERSVIGAAFVISFLTQAALTFELLHDPRTALSIAGQGYPLYLPEVLSFVAVVVVAVGIFLSGYWQKTLAGEAGLRNWRYVAGLKVFIEVVYKGRFAHGTTQYVAKGELATYYPYAIAFGIDREFTHQLERALILDS